MGAKGGIFRLWYFYLSWSGGPVLDGLRNV